MRFQARKPRRNRGAGQHRAPLPVELPAIDLGRATPGPPQPCLLRVVLAVVGGIGFVGAIAMGVYGIMSKAVAKSILGGAVAVALSSHRPFANGVQLDQDT